MTTLQLTKTMDIGAGSTSYTVEILGAKVEEVLTKEVINWADPIPQPDWTDGPSATQPGRQAIDLLNINRVFSITGFIDAKSCDNFPDPGSGVNRTPISASEVRDVLVNMMRAGGTSYFKYGVPADTTGLSGDGYEESSANIYFTSTGFEVHITRMQLVEDGGSEQTGEYRDGSNLKFDYLVTSGAHTFPDSQGLGSPKMGTYKLASKYQVTIEVLHCTENTS